MRKRIGYILMGIAIFHEVVGLFFYSSALRDILNAGVVNSINPPYWDRDAAFWFLMFGVVLFLLGWIAQWALEQTNHIPAFVSWGILGMGSIGVILMPASGFWLVIPVAIVMVRMGGRQQLHTALPK